MCLSWGTRRERLLERCAYRPGITRTLQDVADAAGMSMAITQGVDVRRAPAVLRHTSQQSVPQSLSRVPYDLWFAAEPVEQDAALHLPCSAEHVCFAKQGSPSAVAVVCVPRGIPKISKSMQAWRQVAIHSCLAELALSR